MVDAGQVCVRSRDVVCGAPGNECSANKGELTERAGE
jgi:hypothetical protein